MDAIQKIVLIACLLSIAIMIFDIMYPNDKLHKQVKLIFSLIFILGIFTPIISGKINITIPTSTSIEDNTLYIDFQDKMDEQVLSQAKKRIEQVLSHELSKKGIKTKEISIKINIEDNSCISISEVEIACDSITKAQRDIINEFISNELGEKTKIIINQG